MSDHPPTSGQQRAKQTLRLLAIEFCRRLLHSSSQLLTEPDGVTVVIAPHQDDETLACGGLIARRRNEGLPVHVIFITDSSASHPGHERFTPGALSSMRREEAMRALYLLGMEREAVHFLNEPDGTLKTIVPDRKESLIRRLAERLESIQPQEIFLPCHPDGSSEHDAVFHFVLAAIARTKLSPVIWQYPVWSWWNPRLLVGLWWRTSDCRRLPGEDFVQAKRKALACYASQISPLPPDTTAALPAELVNVFRSDTEYFLRYAWPQPPP
jgi:LmbE family N-acetylglucosaminyl deacetylase